MSLYGNQITIDGVRCGYVHRDSGVNGRYRAVFEREFASIEQIEAINWMRPVVKAPKKEQCPLPVGYGFKVDKISYDSGTKSYEVIFHVAEQYLGDLTPYKADIAAKSAQISALTAELAEADELAISLYETMTGEEAAVNE